MSTLSSTNELKTFNYTATIKLVDGSHLRKLYPQVSTINFKSREFASYDECAVSCRSLMDSVLEKLKTDDALKIGAEVNPTYSGQPTLSKDWNLGEISRFWIYDRGMEKSGHIHAVGQARVFGSAVSTNLFAN